MLAKVLLWWPAAATIGGIIVAAVAVAAGTLSLSLSTLILVLSATLYEPTIRVIWSAIQPTASWTYFNKSGLNPAEAAIYIWPSAQSIAARASSRDAAKRPINLCTTDHEVELAIAAGRSAATEWRPAVGSVAAKTGVPLVPVFVVGDRVPTWEGTIKYLQEAEFPKCRIKYGPPLRLKAREAGRADALWAAMMKQVKKSKA
jgi:hypothetical protein